MEGGGRGKEDAIPILSDFLAMTMTHTTDTLYFLYNLLCHVSVSKLCCVESRVYMYNGPIDYSCSTIFSLQSYYVPVCMYVKVMHGFK